MLTYSVEKKSFHSNDQQQHKQTTIIVSKLNLQLLSKSDEADTYASRQTYYSVGHNLFNFDNLVITV